MAVFKCKMCGGSLEVSEGMTVCECEYCGTKQTLPAFDNEKKINLFNRANRLRFKCEFDAAEGIYQNIVSEFTNEAEAYWGLCLCKYGIEYVEDPLTGNKIPTCHRTSFNSILSDADYLSTLKNADSIAKGIYEAEAKAIDALQQKILSVVKNEEPYDVFICYKESDADKQRTPDSVLAQDIYDNLTSKGLKVFFSRITLEDKLGIDYEPYIFAALHSAKVMLVVTTNLEYVESVWVKNEWARFARLAATDSSKVLIPCYSHIDPEELPTALTAKQAQDMEKLGAMQDLVRGVVKITGKDKAQTAVKEKVVQAESDPTEPLLKRAALFLEDSDWDSAIEYCNKVLDIDPECAKAYYYLFLSDVRINNEESYKMIALENGVSNNNYFKKAKRYSSEKLKAELKLIESKYDSISKINWLNNYYTDKLNYEGVIENGVLKKYNGSEKKVYIPGTIKEIGAEAFQENNTIEEIIMDGVEIIGHSAFWNCRNLKAVKLPDTLQSIGVGAFHDCSFDSIIFPDSIIEICGMAFSGCYRLTSVTIPESVVEIGDLAFEYCRKLTKVTILSPETKFKSTVFRGCVSLDDKPQGTNDVFTDKIPGIIAGILGIATLIGFIIMIGILTSS